MQPRRGEAPAGSADLPGTMDASVEMHFRAHRARVYRWARAMCGRHEDALDVVQDVFLRMLRSRPALPSPAATIAWLRRVTSRVVIDRWRRAAVRRTDFAEVSPPTPDETLAAGELRAQVRAALESLSEQQRLVVIAKCYDRLTFQQIAAELGVSPSTAKTHYVRALAAVRDRLGIEIQSGSRT